MLPLSKIELVFFAVVLILPALQSGASLSADKAQMDCVQLIIHGGMMECTRGGFDDFETYEPYTCEMVCGEQNKKKLPLPNGVCSGSRVKCTDEVRDILLQWTSETEERKKKIMKKWCGS
uniref:Putative secreted salivary gland peptide n=1 Tax=Ixodes scapularis TaxID=6945 RepID=Q5Q991_IXOSC|nr:putative secreted salivary gland peptide [Ixodes scapularis]